MTKRQVGWAAYGVATSFFVAAALVAGSVPVALAICGFSSLLVTSTVIDETNRDAAEKESK